MPFIRGYAPQQIKGELLSHMYFRTKAICIFPNFDDFFFHSCIQQVAFIRSSHPMIILTVCPTLSSMFLEVTKDGICSSLPKAAGT
jgi:hypothetical protein